MTTPKVVRYPLAPLAELMRRTPNGALTELGVSGSTAQGYRRHGLSAEVAERFAERAGFHPFEVWPELRDAVLAELDPPRECASEGCSELIPADANPRRMYCSHRCRDRRHKARWARERYRNDPEYRERRKAESAARHVAERDYVLAQRRRSRRNAKETSARC